MGVKNFKEFRSLLRKGIGTRTQKEFANEVNMAEPTINRMLNAEEISRPRKATLEKIAPQMRGVTLNELLTACGYEKESLKDLIAAVEDSIKNCLELSCNIRRLQALDTLQWRVREYTKDVGARVYIEEKPDSEVNALDAGAESTIELTVSWDYEDCVCTCKTEVYYIQSTEEVYYLFGYNMEHTQVERVFSDLDAKKILKCIFPNTEGEMVRNHIKGFGFYVDGTPKGFIDFLAEHSDVLAKMKMASPNARCLARYLDGDCEAFNEYAQEEYDTCGPCALISDIMTAESELKFRYYEKDVRIPEEEQNACIICEDNGRGIGDKLTRYLYACAKTLGLKTFGAVVYNTCYCEDSEFVYNTDTFGKNKVTE